MSVLTWLLDCLPPARLRAQQARAEADLEAAREQLREVEARDGKVTSLWAALTAQRAENHFQERVKAAYAGKENKHR